VTVRGFSCRGRCIPTSSNRLGTRREHQEPPQRRRPTEDLSFDLVEPLRNLFKDEVRHVGEELGLPAEIVWRQPFPGPGLGVRIVGEVTRERAEILRNADYVVVDEIKKAGLYHELWQSSRCYRRCVRWGHGDGRTYAYPIIIRAVTSDDAMTADWARLPYDVIEKSRTD